MKLAPSAIKISQLRQIFDMNSIMYNWRALYIYPNLTKLKCGILVFFFLQLFPFNEMEQICFEN